MSWTSLLDCVRLNNVIVIVYRTPFERLVTNNDCDNPNTPSPPESFPGRHHRFFRPSSSVTVLPLITTIEVVFAPLFTDGSTKKIQDALSRTQADYLPARPNLLRPLQQRIQLFQILRHRNTLSPELHYHLVKPLTFSHQRQTLQRSIAHHHPRSNQTMLRNLSPPPNQTHPLFCVVKERYSGSFDTSFHTAGFRCFP